MDQDFNEYYSKLSSINTGKEEIENETNLTSMAKKAKEHAIGAVEEAIGLPLGKDLLSMAIKKGTQTLIKGAKTGLEKGATKVKDLIRNKVPKEGDDSQEGEELKTFKSPEEFKDDEPEEPEDNEGLDDDEVQPDAEADEPDADEPEADEPEEAEQQGLDDDEVQPDAEADGLPEGAEPEAIGQDMVPDGAGNVGEGMPAGRAMTEEEASRFTQGPEEVERTGEDTRSGTQNTGESDEAQANTNADNVEQTTKDADDALEEGGEDALEEGGEDAAETGVKSGLEDAIAGSSVLDETGIGEIIQGVAGLGLLFSSFGELFKHNHINKPNIATPSTQYGV